MLTAAVVLAGTSLVVAPRPASSPGTSLTGLQGGAASSRAVVDGGRAGGVIPAGVAKFGVALVLRSSGAGINPAPAGPPTPSGGWTVVLADDFNEPLGYGPGQDPLWYPNQPGVKINGIGGPNNPDYEREVYTGSQVSVRGGLLNLTARPDGRRYLSGMANTSGVHGWTWTPGGGQTMAFEVVAKFPAGAGLFNAFWTSSRDGWSDERDFFEGHPRNLIDSAHVYATHPKTQQYVATTLPFNPSAAFHRYTYIVEPDGSWRLYIDGQWQDWAGGGPKPEASNPMQILLNYAVTGNTGLPSSTFRIASVAVYEDTRHAGRRVSAVVVAPGTTIGVPGSQDTL